MRKLRKQVTDDLGPPWAGQLVGHAIEGCRASSFKDLQFLLIGPLGLVMKLFVSWRLKH